LAEDKDKKLPVPAATPLPSPKKARRQFIKERELAGFAALYNNHATPEQICRTLNMPRSTYYRYLRALAAQQEELLKEHGTDELFAVVGKTRHTFNYSASKCIKIIENKEGKYSEDAEAAALNLLCEIQAAELRLVSEGPISTMKELPMNIKRKLITDKNGEQTVEEIEIEIEDGDREEDSTVA
jgi:hypothetical protein